MKDEWQLHREDGIAFWLPPFLKRHKRLPLYKGRLVRKDPATEILLTVDADAHASWLAVFRENMKDVPSVFEYQGVLTNYHYRGESVVRPGGAELQITQRMLATGAEAHGFDVVFPLGTRLIKVGMSNASGGISWQDFKELTDKVTRSIEIYDSA